MYAGVYVYRFVCIQVCMYTGMYVYGYVCVKRRDGCNCISANECAHTADCR